MQSNPRSPVSVVLLGVHGLLGNAFRRTLSDNPDFRVIELGRAELNLTNPAHFERVLGELEFDVLVNAAAYTAVDDCEIQGDLAYLVNAHAPGMLARICARRNVRMVQFSTDYVFDGNQDTPYTEEDLRNPLSVYGRTKLLGENLVTEASAHHLLVRLSWLFGPGRAAFPDWLISRASNQATVEVVSDKFACPSFSTDAARAFLPWLGDPTMPGGIFHWCNPPACSWLEYGQHVLDCALDAGIPLATTKASPISITALPGLHAKRPTYSALAVEKFTRTSGLAPRHWREAVREYVMEKFAGGSPLERN